jgi:hypothetical protein
VSEYAQKGNIMTLYSCDGDAVLAIQIINFSAALLACIIIAWTRDHGETETDEQARHNAMYPESKFKGFTNKYADEIIAMPPQLYPQDCDTLREMVRNNERLSYLVAALPVYNLNRPMWRRIRKAILSNGLGQEVGRGELMLNESGMRYIGL